MGNNTHSYIEIALDYIHAGLFEEAIRLLDAAPATNPMVKYTQGWAQSQLGNRQAADSCFTYAQQMSPDYCFPHAVEYVLVLATAIEINPADARACYYLGNFWYAHRRYEEAIACWERSRELDAFFPTVHRNLGLAYMNKQHNTALALAAYERAFSLDPADPCLLFELDQLYKKMGRTPAERLAHMERHLELVEQRKQGIGG